MDLVPVEHPIEWYATFGGDVGPDSHGDVNLGIRKGPYSLSLQTDTLDVRGEFEGSHGKSWVGARYAAFAAEMLITPWKDGAPDPASALNAMYGGLDAGFLRYASQGFYGGLQGYGRYYYFYENATTEIAVPEPRVVVAPELVGGRWTPDVHLKATLGLHLSPDMPVAPHLRMDVHMQPAKGWFAPLVESTVVIAENQDNLITTRVGGLNPYVVPLAGAAWAEFHAEDVASLRVAPQFRGSLGQVGLVLGPGVDVVWLGGTGGESGIFFDGSLGYKRFFTDLSAGWSPSIERQEGVGAWGGWLRFGWGWG